MVYSQIRKIWILQQIETHVRVGYWLVAEIMGDKLK